MSNLLIIDSSIKDIDVFIGDINSNTNYIIYENWMNLMDYINVNVENIGFVYHYIGYQRFPFLRNKEEMQNSTNSTLEELISGVFKFEFLDFIEKVKLVNQNVTIDLLTCNVFSNNIQSDINTIKTNYEINIRYSTDEMGILSWIQESDNVNIKGIYFKDAMSWGNVLNVGINIDYLEIFEKNVEFYNGKEREVYSLKDDLIIDSSGIINDRVYIQLKPDIIVDGNNKKIVIRTEYYKGLFVTNHINVNSTNKPFIRNIRVEFENKEKNIGSGIIRTGQEYYEIKDYRRD